MTHTHARTHAGAHTLPHRLLLLHARVYITPSLFLYSTTIKGLFELRRGVGGFCSMLDDVSHSLVFGAFVPWDLELNFG